MRIALLLGGETKDDAETTLDAGRLVTLPPSARLANALASCLGAEAVGNNGAIVLAPVGSGLVASDAWQAIESGIATLDDDHAIEAEIAEARRLLDEGWLEAAREAYERCELVLAEETSTRRVEVLMCLAEIAEHLGPSEDAARRLDQALALAPGHRPAILRRIELARRDGDSVTAAAMGARVLQLAQSGAFEITSYRQIADDCLAAAATAMRTAIAMDPGDRALLERLRVVLEAAGEYAQAVDVAVQLAELLEDPSSRARAFVAAAEMCAAKVGNAGRAVALYEAAIADDPEVPGAFEAIESVLVNAGDYVGAERAYVRQLERLKGRDAAQATLLEKLAKLRELQLGDRRGAIVALDRLVHLRPDNLDARAKLASLLEANGEDALATKCLEIVAWQAPTRAATFKSLYQVFTRIGDTDRAYAACGVLVHLGEADIDEQLTYQQFAPEVMPNLTQPLSELSWTLLQPESYDAELTAIIAALTPAAVAVKIEELRGKRLLPQLGRKQVIERSTITAVRTIDWVAKFLGVDTPDVYVRSDEVPGGIAVLPTIEPAIALGPSILSGRSVSELTFLVARELASLKMQGRLLAMYPTLPELRHVVTSGIALAMGTVDLPHDVMHTKGQLASRLDPNGRRALSAAVARLEERPKGDTQIDLLDWVRNVERTACRVGLLATGDVTVAARILSVDGRAMAGMTAADRVRDLVPFSVSQRYAELRSALGLSARISYPPPSAPVTTRVLDPSV